MHGLPPPRLGSVRPADVHPASRRSIVAGLLRMAAAAGLIGALVVMLDRAAAPGRLQPAATVTLMEDPIR